MTHEAIPDGWRWMRLGDCLAEPLVNGRSHRTADEGFPVLRVSAIRDGRVLLHERKTAAWSAEDAQPFLAQEGDFFVVRGNGSLRLVGRGGLVGAVADAVGFPDKFIRVRTRAELVDRRFLSLVWESESVRQHLETAARSTSGLYMISQNVVEDVAIPVPPLMEQRRILAAMDSHLSCLTAGTGLLVRSAKQTQRYVEALRDSAISGELPLVPSRQRSPADNDSESLPDGWRWATVGECAAAEPNAIVDGPFGSKLKSEHYVQAGPRVVRLQNVGRGRFIDAHASVSPEHFATLHRHRVFADDVVIAALGEDLPRACVIPASLGPAIVKADCVRFKPAAHLLLPAYAVIALNARATRQRVARMVHGVGRPRLNVGELKSIRIPLPPLTVQSSIIREFEMLMENASRLQHNVDLQLARSARLRRSLLVAAVAGRLS